MKLHEEFREYETMWEVEPEETLKEELDPVDRVLEATPDIEFNYKGFDRDYFQDTYSPSYGHDTVTTVYQFPDYTYEVDATTVFEDLRDIVIPKHANEVKPNELLTKYLELEQAWNASTPETEATTCEAMELFLAENLEEFAELFYQQLLAKYADDAEAWQESSGHAERKDGRY